MPHIDMNENQKRGLGFLLRMSWITIFGFPVYKT